jgi:hypothetical protein
MTATAAQRAGRVLLVMLVALMAACAWWPPLDAAANAQVDAGLKRAVATYATARILNGVISVVQRTEVAAAPAGIGMTFSPGEILDPLNDLVGQFSHLMLAAMVAFGIEKVLLTAGASWVISLIFTLTAAAWGVLWLRGGSPRWLGRALLVLLVTRFAMPVSLIATDAVFQHFLAADYEESQEVLKGVQNEASQIDAAPSPEEQPGLWERLKGSTFDFFADARAKLESLKNSAENAVERIIRLMVIFALETIVLPLLFIWALLALGRSVLEPAAARLND